MNLARPRSIWVRPACEKSVSGHDGRPDLVNRRQNFTSVLRRDFSISIREGHSKCIVTMNLRGNQAGGTNYRLLREFHKRDYAICYTITC